jgi:hypothetical protein
LVDVVSHISFEWVEQIAVLYYIDKHLIAVNLPSFTNIDNMSAFSEVSKEPEECNKVRKLWTNY